MPTICRARAREGATLTEDSLPRAVGTYEVLRELGRGSMAVVWLARTTGPGGFERLCALKKIHEHLSVQPEFVDLFLNEARIAARIHHPNVIQVHDIDTFEGQYYLRMDYVSGATLFRALERTWNEGQPFPLDVAALLFAGVADGLHAAHELTDGTGVPLGVIHRDLGPHNIMLGHDGIPRVMDFGIAKALDRASGTRPGTFRGTVAFMSPEHVRGEPLDRRADIFSLGVVLWECTVGARLFRHTTAPGTMSRILSMDVPRPTTLRRDYPPQLEAVVMAALERDPDHRPSTARELAESLRRVVVEMGVVPSQAPLEQFMAQTFPDHGAASPRAAGARREEEVFGNLSTLPSGTRPLLIGARASHETEVEVAAVDEVTATRAVVHSGPVETRPERTHAAGDALSSPVAVGRAVDDAERITAFDRRPPGRRVGADAPAKNILPAVAAVSALLLTVLGVWAWRVWPEVPVPKTGPALVSLTFDVRPPNAAVRIDGQTLEGPLVVPLSPHQYQVEVSAPGHIDRTLTVSAEDSRVIAVELDPVPTPRKRGRGRRSRRR